MTVKTFIVLPQKILESAVFKIDNRANKKCLLSGKYSYYNDLLKIMWHWRLEAENSALITGINYILKYIKIENIYFKL